MKNFEEPSGSLKGAIATKYGSVDKFQSQFNTALAGIQGSGWGWLVYKDKELQIITTPVVFSAIQGLIIESRPCDRGKSSDGD
jgi:superoxide dismutase